MQDLSLERKMSALGPSPRYSPDTYDVAGATREGPWVEYLAPKHDLAVQQALLQACEQLDSRSLPTGTAQLVKFDRFWLRVSGGPVTGGRVSSC